MKVAVLQSSYIPWKGYFDLIHDAELFIFYDDVQFTKNDWRNRNKIQTPNGPIWLSVPVGDHINRNINEVEIKDHKWQEKHWKSIKQNYSRTKYFSWYESFLWFFYMENTWTSLSELNQTSMKWVSKNLLHCTTKFENSTEYKLEGVKEDRLLDLLTQVGCTTYHCGPASKHYLNTERFKAHGIEVVFKDTNYPEYKQVYPPFSPFVSILDLLLCTGPEAPYYIWGWREQK